MTRLLLALCLCLALAPAALANDDEAPPDEPGARPAEVDGCHEPEGDDDAEQPAADGGPEACEPDGEDGQGGDDFLRRNWRVGGDATGFSDGVLEVTVTSVLRVPARFREQAGRLEGLQLAVLVSRHTKLTRTRTARGAGRRGSRRASPGTLERARRVKVEGKLLPPSRWRREAESLRVPTVRASRVTVVR